MRRLALLLPLLFAAACGVQPPGRVLVLGLDGLDPNAVDLLMSEGKLPNFARLRQEGAYGRLASEEPMLSPILWTTIATGKGAAEHGIGHFVAVDRQTGEQLPVTSRMRRVKALWNIASEAGRRVAVVGWWATWPPEEVEGAIVSDHAAYHFLFEEGFSGGPQGQPRTWPPELAARIEPLLRRPAELSPEELARFVAVPAEELARPVSFDDDLGHFRWALATATSYRDIGLALWRDERPALALVYIEGGDSTSHLFGHLFRAEGLAGELAVQQARYGRAVEEMYLFLDRLVGEYLEALDDDATLVVLSDHGFQLGELHDDPSRTRDLRRVSERFHRLEGVLYLYGNGVKRHGRIDGARLVDVAPTVLALLGLPPAADMPGRVLAEALARPPALERVATYEGASGTEVAAAPRDAEADQAVLEHLRALGYLGGAESSPQGDRNLAAIHFQAGRYEEAAAIYRRLVERDPDDGSARTSLAGVLGALGRYDEALEQLDAALAADALNVEAYHNRAVLHERRGDRQAAIEDYRTGLRYRPDYEPSRRALMRLAGPGGGAAAAASPSVAEALALAEKASRLARRGDYASALGLLDRAEALAPETALVFQYRSNVAYLMGDRAAAIRALERALELEPDNALYRNNLESLRAGDAGQGR